MTQWQFHSTLNRNSTKFRHGPTSEPTGTRCIYANAASITAGTPGHPCAAALDQGCPHPSSDGTLDILIEVVADEQAPTRCHVQRLCKCVENSGVGLLRSDRFGDAHNIEDLGEAGCR